MVEKNYKDKFIYKYTGKERKKLEESLKAERASYLEDVELINRLYDMLDERYENPDYLPKNKRLVKDYIGREILNVDFSEEKISIVFGKDDILVLHALGD